MAAERSPRGATFLALLFAAGCASSGLPPERLEPGRTLHLESDSSHATADVRVEGGRITEGRNTLLIEFSPPTTDLVGATAAMPVHGHSAVARTIEHPDAGWRVSDLILNMAGLWDVTLELDVQGDPDRVQFTVDVP